MTAALTSQLDSAAIQANRSEPYARHECSGAKAVDQIRLRLGVINAEIECSIDGLADEYAELYGGYDAHGGDAMVSVRVGRGRSRYTMGRRFVVSGSEGRMFSVRRIEEVLPHVEWALNWEVVRRMDDFLQLHAGVMERDGVGVVFPAAPGSGKTTLCAGLLSRGWRFLSDEFALIDGEGMIHPYPKALCIKEGSFEVMEHLGLPMVQPRRYRKGKKGRVAYVNPRVAGDDSLGRKCRLGHVVFPKFEQGATPRLRSLTRGETGFELAQLSFNLRKKGNEGMTMLMGALQGADCHRLESGDIDRTCDLIEKSLLG